MKRLLHVALICSFFAPGPAVAGTTTTGSIAQAIVSGTVAGTVLDARAAPLSGATVTAVSTTTRVVVTSSADGSFRLQLPPGLYDLTVRKGGFQNAEDVNVTVVATATTPLRIVLTEATVSDLRVIGSVSAARASASSSITPIASLNAATLATRHVSLLQEVLPELPGVSFGSRGQTTDSYQYFTVRGAAIETRVYIDGHPVTTGYGGRRDLSQVNPDMFGSVDVFRCLQMSSKDRGSTVPTPARTE